MIKNNYLPGLNPSPGTVVAAALEPEPAPGRANPRYRTEYKDQDVVGELRSRPDIERAISKLQKPEAKCSTMME